MSMGKHIKVILGEMFRVVGDTYSEEKVAGDSWYLQNSWTREQEAAFAEWLRGYLANPDARKEIMEFPRSRNIDAAVRMFLFMYGWKRSDYETDK